MATSSDSIASVYNRLDQQMKKFVVVDYEPFSPYLEYREHENDIKYFATSGPYQEIIVDSRLTVYERMGEVIGIRINMPKAIDVIKDDAYASGIKDALDVFTSICNNINNPESKKIVEEVLKRTSEVLK